MSAAALERLLARLYTDAQLRRRFLDRPAEVARSAGLNDTHVAALLRIDRAGLELAADSYARKRQSRG